MAATSRFLLSPRRARRLSRQLRRVQDPDLDRRRAVIALSLLSLGSTGLVALYQSGVIRHLPELPGRWLDADDVDAAPEAYRAGVGDAFLGLNSYAITALLAAAGGRRRAERHPWLPLLLLGKVVADTVIAGRLAQYQWSRFRAFCMWCLVTTAATAATVPLALPEALAALAASRPRPRRWRR